MKKDILLKTLLLLAINTSYVNAMEESAERRAFKAIGVDNPVQPASKQQITAIIGDDAAVRTIYETMRTQDASKWPDLIKRNYLTFLEEKMGAAGKKELLTTRESRFMAVLSDQPLVAQESAFPSVKLKHVETKTAGAERKAAEQQDFTGLLKKPDAKDAAPATTALPSAVDQVSGAARPSVAEIDERVKKATQARLAKEKIEAEESYRQATLGARLEIQKQRNAAAIAQLELLQQQATDAELTKRGVELTDQLKDLGGRIAEARATFAEAARLKSEEERRNKEATENQQTADVINMSITLDTLPISPARKEEIRAKVEAIMIDPMAKAAERESVEVQNGIRDADSANAFIFGESAKVYERYFLARCFAMDLVELAARQRDEAAALLAQATANESKAEATLMELERDAERISTALNELSQAKK